MSFQTPEAEVVTNHSGETPIFKKLLTKWAGNEERVSYRRALARKHIQRFAGSGAFDALKFSISSASFQRVSTAAWTCSGKKHGGVSNATASTPLSIRLRYPDRPENRRVLVATRVLSLPRALIDATHQVRASFSAA